VLQCGGERPGCNNCARSNRLCTGYQRKHAFILSKDMVAGEATASKHLPLLTDEDNSGAVLVSRWRIDQDKPSPPASMSRVFPIHGVQPPTTHELQRVSPRNAFREKLCSVFVDHHLPLDVVDLRQSAAKQRNWFVLVLGLPSLSPALENAVLALCTAQLGRHSGQPALVHESLALYSASLRELRQAVVDPVTRCNEQNIAASLALLMYEMSECPGRMIHGYLSHLNGAMQLLQVRGPEAHASGLSHSVFQVLRTHSVSHPSRSPLNI
jgi:hypothetical protein